MGLKLIEIFNQWLKKKIYKKKYLYNGTKKFIKENKKELGRFNNFYNLSEIFLEINFWLLLWFFALQS